MIKAENLSFGFPQKDLYHRISFTLEDNCHCVLIGSNGTGKTTLVDLIRRPDSYLFDGTLTREGVGRMGYVSQFAARDKEQSAPVYEDLCRDFLDLQERIGQVCTRMETAEDLEPLMEEYQQLLDESESMDADNYEANIHRQLHLAGLSQKSRLPLSALSGGEYKLVQIIRQILRRPGLLVMDEPDVFLDFENLTGLRELINAYEGTLLVVTHNRYLLNHCFDRVWHLENAGLQEFDGSFLEYNLALLRKKIELQEAAGTFQAEIQRATEMVERLRKEASEVVDPLKGRTLKGKVSYLKRIRNWAVQAPFVELRRPRISLPPVEGPGEEPRILLDVKDFNLTFDSPLLEGVSFQVREGEKVAIVGPNGTGKTTLLRRLRENDHPSITFHPEAKVGFFSQLQEETLNEENTIYQEFFELGFETKARVEEHLENYCFDPNTLHRPIAHLSGGEKNLLQLAKLAVGEHDLLLLDEPSSHLDTYAQIALENAIEGYKGAVLMVSHDFYSIVNCADTILYVDEGTLRPIRPRSFRKMIYRDHFPQSYLELEQKKKELEVRIQTLLAEGDHESAKALCDILGSIIEHM